MVSTPVMHFIILQRKSSSHLTNRQTGITSTTTVLGTSLFGGNTGGEGLYFVKRITARTIKLSKSRSDIYNNKFVTIESSTPVTNNKFDVYDFRQRTLETQKLYRRFSTPVDDGTVTLTNPGFTGLLLNGVEILNYKSKDVIKYGEVKRIDVLNGGDDFDVINPPVLHVEDSVGNWCNRNRFRIWFSPRNQNY